MRLILVMLTKAQHDWVSPLIDSSRYTDYIPKLQMCLFPDCKCIYLLAN